MGSWRPDNRVWSGSPFTKPTAVSKKSWWMFLCDTARNSSLKMVVAVLAYLSALLASAGTRFPPGGKS
jgi:hypothetical protein